MYKIGQRVKVHNRNSTIPNDNIGTLVKIHLQYVVTLDSGLTGLFNSEDVFSPNNYTVMKEGK